MQDDSAKRSKTILITGAAGRIGRAFSRDHRHGEPLRFAAYRLRLADHAWPEEAAAPGGVPRPAPGPEQQEQKQEHLCLDIRDAQACLQACAGVDTVLHLAADASPEADFRSSLLPTNIVGSYNLFEAARAQGCRRVVFASSAQAVEGYPLDLQVSEQMPARPGNLYGASKIFGEALADCFSREPGGLSCVAVRIANLAEFRAGERHSARDTAAFISERDLLQLLWRCIEADLSGYTLVHGVSDNRYKRLAIDRTRQLLGYTPQDDGFAILEGGRRP